MRADLSARRACVPGPARKRRVDGVQLLPCLGGTTPLGVCAERLPGEPIRTMLVVLLLLHNFSCARRDERRNTPYLLPAKI